jgi:hypothetical protein
VPVAIVAIALLLGAASAAEAAFLTMREARSSVRSLAAKTVREGDGDGYVVLGCTRLSAVQVACDVHDWGYHNATVACDYNILVTLRRGVRVAHGRHAHCFASRE